MNDMSQLACVEKLILALTVQLNKYVANIIEFFRQFLRQINDASSHGWELHWLLAARVTPALLLSCLIGPAVFVLILLDYFFNALDLVEQLRSATL